MLDLGQVELRGEPGGHPCLPFCQGQGFLQVLGMGPRSYGVGAHSRCVTFLWYFAVTLHVEGGGARRTCRPQSSWDIREKWELL